MSTMEENVQQRPTLRSDHFRVVALLLLVVVMFDVCHCDDYDRRLGSVSLDPSRRWSPHRLLRYNDVDYGAIWRSRGGFSLGQLYRAVMRENARRQLMGNRVYDAAEYRKKRPTSKSYGLLGIDNLDFTASTLDRARVRNRKPNDAEWEIAKQMSKQIATSGSSGRARQLSMSIFLTDLRRMLDMIKAGK